MGKSLAPTAITLQRKFTPNYLYNHMQLATSFSWGKLHALKEKDLYPAISDTFSHSKLAKEVEGEKIKNT